MQRSKASISSRQHAAVSSSSSMDLSPTTTAARKGIKLNDPSLNYVSSASCAPKNSADNNNSVTGAVVPNVFVIREIDFNDSENFLYSPNIKEIALKNKWWEENTPFDFTKIYSGGEYHHQYYSGRR